jgi:hypothetical protein
LPAVVLPAFLARFRAYMIEDYLPFVEKQDLIEQEQLELFGNEAKDYRRSR